MTPWVGARVVGGLAIVIGLLALVAISWYARGTDDATRLFQLLQGVILGTLGWLYGTQGFEAARQTAARESTARHHVASEAEVMEERIDDLSRELAESRDALRLLHADETVREKVDEAMRRVKG